VLLRCLVEEFLKIKLKFFLTVLRADAGKVYVWAGGLKTLCT